jgi:hypothetical protein
MCYYIKKGDIDMVISRRRGRKGENAASENPSAQETKNGPRQVDSGRRRVEQDRNPKGPERDYIVNQWTVETS